MGSNRSIVGLSTSFVVAFVLLSCQPAKAETFGTFTANMIGFNSTTAVDAGDIDNDGDLDMVVSTPFSVGWVKNNGLGLSWSSYTSIDSTNWGCATVFVKDFDLDGKLDVIGGRTTSGICYATVWKNQGGGTAWTQTSSTIGINGPVHWVEAADIDADGKIDLAYAQYNQIGWIPGTGSVLGVAIVLEADPHHPQYRCAHPANLDADPALEIVGTMYYGYIPYPSPAYNANVKVWQSTGGSVTLSNNQLNPLSGAWAAWDLDFDGDGDQDVAVSSLGSSGTRVWSNQAAVLTSHSQLTNGATSLRSAYFSNSSPFRQSLVTGGDYRILNWTGTTWDTTTVAVGTGNNSQSGLDIGDINLDGKLDIIGPFSSNNMLQWWRKP